VHLDAGMRLHELRHVRRQLVESDAVHGCQPHRACDDAGGFPQPFFEASKAIQQLTALCVEEPPGLGGFEPRPCAAVDEWLAVPRFERLELWLTADCEMKPRCAALVKLPVSTREQNVCNVSMCMVRAV